MCAKLAVFFRGRLITGKPLAMSKQNKAKQKIPSPPPLYVRELGTGTKLRSESRPGAVLVFNFFFFYTFSFVEMFRFFLNEGKNKELFLPELLIKLLELGKKKYR